MIAPRTASSGGADHRSASQRVLIGEGAVARIGGTLEAMGVGTVGVLAGERGIATPLAKSVIESLRSTKVQVWTGAHEHTPLGDVMAASEVFSDAGVEAVVAIGGGSVSDLAKAVVVAIAGEMDIRRYFIERYPDGTVSDRPVPADTLPVVAVPTTLSAAELTPGAGVTDDGHKYVLWDWRLAATLSVYETSSLADLPANIVAGTGMNAVAHCVEALYSSQGTSISDAVAEKGLELLIEGMIRYLRDGEHTPAARHLLWSGAVASGQALSNARVCLHHAVCHVLGAVYGAGHGELNAAMLSHAVDFNAEATPELSARMAEVVQRATARAGLTVSGLPLGQALRSFEQAIGAPVTLPAVGVRRADPEKVWAALRTERGLAFNPRPVERDDVERLLRAAGADTEPVFATGGHHPAEESL